MIQPWRENRRFDILQNHMRSHNVSTRVSLISDVFQIRYDIRISATGAWVAASLIGCFMFFFFFLQVSIGVHP
jgi:hypothetical protein